MAKQPSNKKTVISGEFGTSPRQERAPIGFQPSHMRAADTAIVCSRQREPEIGFNGLPIEVANTMLSVMKWYMEERVRRCYREGVDKDFMTKVDKIYTKFFETID